MTPAFVFRCLPSHLGQVLLVERRVKSKQFTVLNDFVSADLDLVSVLLRQASAVTSRKAAMDTANGWYNRRIEPLLNQLRVLRELVQILDARLTLLEAPPSRQPTGGYIPTQGLAGIASINSTVDTSGPSTLI